MSQANRPAPITSIESWYRNAIAAPSARAETIRIFDAELALWRQKTPRDPDLKKIQDWRAHLAGLEDGSITEGDGEGGSSAFTFKGS